MQTFSSKSYRLKKERGFSLIELMVVIAIIGILAAMVRVSIYSEASKVKSVAFNLRGDMNFARSEAVSRNRDVRVDFFFDGDPVVGSWAVIRDTNPADGFDDLWDRDPANGNFDADGYGIWIDDDVDGIFDNDFVDANGNDICEKGEGDCVLKEVVFADEVQFYDKIAVNGPGVTPSGLPWPIVPGDGVALSLGVNWLAFQSNGTCNRNGTIYIYAPSPDDPLVMNAPPLAMVISTTTGRVRVERWRTSSGSWETR